jgi:hypothetical protein
MIEKPRQIAKERILRRGNDCAMKFDVLVDSRIIAVDRGLHGIELGLNGTEVRVGAALGGVFGGRAFDRHQKLDDMKNLVLVAKILDVEAEHRDRFRIGYEGARALSRNDDAVVLQAADGFANGRATDAIPRVAPVASCLALVLMFRSLRSRTSSLTPPSSRYRRKINLTSSASSSMTAILPSFIS